MGKKREKPKRRQTLGSHFCYLLHCSCPAPALVLPRAPRFCVVSPARQDDGEFGAQKSQFERAFMIDPTGLRDPGAGACRRALQEPVKVVLGARFSAGDGGGENLCCHAGVLKITHTRITTHNLAGTMQARGRSVARRSRGCSTPLRNLLPT